MSKNLFDTATVEEKAEMAAYADAYLAYLRLRSDRERVQYFVQKLEADGFKKFELGGSQDQLPSGTRFYYLNQGKNLICGIVGQTFDSFTVIGTHLDVPHLDLKPHFLKECADQGACVLRTQYYGGLKTYQYATTPLVMKIAVHKDGKMQHYSIGDKPEDPVFTIPDLLIHLQKSQTSHTTPDVIRADELNVLGISSKGQSKRFTDNFLRYFEKLTGLNEDDLPYCEFQLFPAYEPRYVGIDKAAIGCSGQDDGICCFAAYEALLKLTEMTKYTAVVVMHSYEETGSNGTFGAQSNFLPFALKDLMYRANLTEARHQAALFNSLCIAADVTCLYDVNFASAHDKLNAAVINHGVGLERYTGFRGKNGTSEVAAELLGLIRRTARNDLYQLSTLGETDVGGGGTTAKYLAHQLSCSVVDIGPGVMNMHSPFEITGVADLWACILVYSSLLERKE